MHTLKKVLTVLFVVFVLALEVGCGGGAKVVWTNTGGSVSSYTVSTLAYGHNLLYAGMNGNGVCKYDGTNWTDTDGSVSSYGIPSLAYVHSVLYAGTDNGVWKYGGAK